MLIVDGSHSGRITMLFTADEFVELLEVLVTMFPSIKPSAENSSACVKQARSTLLMGAGNPGSDEERQQKGSRSLHTSTSCVSFVSEVATNGGIALVEPKIRYVFGLGMMIMPPGVWTP